MQKGEVGEHLWWEGDESWGYRKDCGQRMRCWG